MYYILYYIKHTIERTFVCTFLDTFGAFEIVSDESNFTKVRSEQEKFKIEISKKIPTRSTNRTIKSSSKLVDGPRSRKLGNPRRQLLILRQILSVHLQFEGSEGYKDLQRITNTHLSPSPGNFGRKSVAEKGEGVKVAKRRARFSRSTTRQVDLSHRVCIEKGVGMFPDVRWCTFPDMGSVLFQMGEIAGIRERGIAGVYHRSQRKVVYR